MDIAASANNIFQKYNYYQIFSLQNLDKNIFYDNIFSNLAIDFYYKNVESIATNFSMCSHKTSVLIHVKVKGFYPAPTNTPSLVTNKK